MPQTLWEICFPEEVSRHFFFFPTRRGTFKIITFSSITMVTFKDEEANHETAPSKSLASIKASVGWRLPEVKLASWDPENEKQWNVSTS